MSSTTKVVRRNSKSENSLCQVERLCFYKGLNLFLIPMISLIYTLLAFYLQGLWRGDLLTSNNTEDDVLAEKEDDGADTGDSDLELDMRFTLE